MGFVLNIEHSQPGHLSQKSNLVCTIMLYIALGQNGHECGSFNLHFVISINI